MQLFMTMAKQYYLVLSLVSLFYLAGCERTNQAQFFGIGTIISVEVKTSPSNAKHFINELQTFSDQQQKDLYAWGDGELSELNKALARSECLEGLSKDFLSLLISAKNLSQQSEGLFEPGIAPLVELWGFHDANKMLSQAPNGADIQTHLKNLNSINSLQISGNEACATAPISLDFGAIGKGWAANMVIELLDSYKIDNALIDFGGDMILKGNNAQGKPWKIGLRNPDQKDPPASFELSTNLESTNNTLAVFTSGDYERRFEFDGISYHHILDPRTGYPANSVRSVTVIHHDPVLADAAATALFIAGNDWPRIAKKMSVDDVLVIFPNMQAEITSSLQTKTTWLNKQYQPKIVTLN